MVYGDLIILYPKPYSIYLRGDCILIRIRIVILIVIIVTRTVIIVVMMCNDTDKCHGVGWAGESQPHHPRASECHLRATLSGKLCEGLVM